MYVCVLGAFCGLIYVIFTNFPFDIASTNFLILCSTLLPLSVILPTPIFLLTSIKCSLNSFSSSSLKIASNADLIIFILVCIKGTACINVVIIIMASHAVSGYVFFSCPSLPSCTRIYLPSLYSISASHIILNSLI